MLKKLSIKQQLILIMSIPLIVVISLSVHLAYDAYLKTKSLEKIEKVVILSTKIGELVHETQKERELTAGFLGSRGTKFENALRVQREVATLKREELLHYLKNFEINKYNNDIKNALTLGLTHLKDVEVIRYKISHQSVEPESALHYYTKMNALFINVIGFSMKSYNRYYGIS